MAEIERQNRLLLEKISSIIIPEKFYVEQPQRITDFFEPKI
jgi:hypothetical protein